MKIKIFTLTILSLLFYSCSSVSVEDERAEFHRLVNEIDDQFNDSLFNHAHWGVKIQSLSTGEIWYEKNADKMFMPASNEKIITGASSLLTLGPDFRFRTILAYRGEIEDSILKGDLLVFGDGDPTLYTRFYDDPAFLFYEWAHRLKNLGISGITGDIIGIDDLFDDEYIGYGWSHGGLSYWYSAEIGPLVLNENYVDLKIIPPVGIDSLIRIIPNLESNYFEIINRLTLIDSGRSDINVDRPFATNKIILEGELRRDRDEIMVSPSIHNPTLFYVTVLKEVIERSGIKVDGSARDCDDTEDKNFEIDSNKVINYHYSPPLNETLAVLMKVSQNLYAENFARTLGWYKFGQGTFSNARKAVEEVLLEMGIEPDTYRYMDGSGLSRYNYVSPGQIITILSHMRVSKYWEIWRDALPIAGIDGTLKNRMKATGAEGNVRAKTGTISNVRGLSGYLSTKSGEEIVFSFLINGHLRSSRETEYITDRVLELIANFGN